MDKWAKDKNHKYYYSTLAEKYKANPLTMPLDEYFMYYYGASEQEGYSPYGKSFQKMIGENLGGNLGELLEEGALKNVWKKHEIH